MTYDNAQLRYGGNPQTLTTSSSYDAFGNLLTKTDPSNSRVIETDTYDIAGNQLTARDASGVTTNNSYDCLGNKTASWLSVSGTAQKDHWQGFTYDPLGRLLTQTTKLCDSAGNLTTQSVVTNTYDGYGDKHSSSDSTVGGQPEKWLYDERGNVIEHWAMGVSDYTDARATRDTNDPEGNVTGESLPGNANAAGASGSQSTATTAPVTPCCRPTPTVAGPVLSTTAKAIRPRSRPRFPATTTTPLRGMWPLPATATPPSMRPPARSHRPQMPLACRQTTATTRRQSRRPPKLNLQRHRALPPRPPSTPVTTCLAGCFARPMRMVSRPRRPTTRTDCHLADDRCKDHDLDLRRRRPSADPDRRRWQPADQHLRRLRQLNRSKAPELRRHRAQRRPHDPRLAGSPDPANRLGERSFPQLDLSGQCCHRHPGDGQLRRHAADQPGHQSQRP